MRRFVGFAIALCGCPWVSNEEFDTVWDADGDGWGYVDDCAPEDGSVFPGAADPRGDGCDADCGTEPDADGDDWPDDVDCDDEDPEVFPCSPFEEDGGVDHDCDGNPGIRPADAACPQTDPDFPDAEPRASCPVGAATDEP